MHSKKYDLVVVVRVNTECALRCSFCGFSRELERPMSVIDDNRIRKFGQSLQAFRAARNQRVPVSWLGFASQSLGVSLNDFDTVEKLSELRSVVRERRCGKMPACCRDCHATHVFEKFSEF